MLANYDVLDLTASIRVTLLLGRHFISGDVTLRRVRDSYVIRVMDFCKSRFFPFIALIRFSFFSFYLVSLPLLPLLRMCFRHGFFSELDPQFC